MATRNRIPSVDPYQSIVDVQSLLSFISCAILENASQELEFGRYLILSHCRDTLNAAKDALEPKKRLEVVNG